MSWYDYRAASGEMVEAEFPIGKAPSSIKRKGVVFERVYTAPTIRQLSRLDRGEKPSISHQLPHWYGYGQRETVWKEHMQKAGIEDTPHRRQQMVKAGLGPKPKYIEQRSKEAAAKAGALGKFTKDGKPLARTKSAALEVVSRAKDRGDKLDWQ